MKTLVLFSDLEWVSLHYMWPCSEFCLDAFRHAICGVTFGAIQFCGCVSMVEELAVFSSLIWNGFLCTIWPCPKISGCLLPCYM